MEALLDAVGRPHDRLRAFHVAGTNGKGSVSATLATILRRQGLRVALYTSPHLVDFRERFLIDGVAITEQDVIDWIRLRTPLVERLNATFFEATTAMAFELFAVPQVDVAVIEVGLGGRLDATNVITPIVAGVASIGIDHVEFLGDTRERIAWEKAGIFKRDRPAVIGEPDPHIRALLAQFAHDAGATPVRVVADEYTVSDIVVEAAGGTTFSIEVKGGRPSRLHTTLSGAHQATNAALAYAMLDAAGPPYTPVATVMAEALATVFLPGRFQRVGSFIFDVAHNPDGATVLARTLAAVRPPGPIVALLSVLNDKDWRGVMTALAGAVDEFVLTNAPTAPANRAWRADEALAFATAQGWRAEVAADFDDALSRAKARAGTVLVTGSFHTVGDAMASLQLSPFGG
ncbi:MAG TPA: folylpolyglutamate synthase/dihydrofolate synthase family protein [Gemmatimonadaceae bacterium]|nr:folylpolyglutamate synthase/dihydrofolate synthase family protein [Gemmatimonadaceae bacterium]